MALSIENSYDLLCRACQKTADETNGMLYMYSKDTNFSEFRSISELFTKYLSLKIDEYKEISPFICIECYESLKNFHQFRKMCVNSHFDFLKRKHVISDCSVRLKKLQFAQEPTNDPADPVPGNISLSGNAMQSLQSIFAMEPSLVYPCPHCTMVFMTSDSLDRHKRTHVLKPAKDLTCTVCGLQNTSVHGLKVHMYYHEQRREVCEICQRFSYSRLLPYHRATKHHVVKHDDFYECLECKTKLKTVHEVEVHEQMHPNEAFQCNRCPKKFKFKGTFGLHQKEHDRDERAAAKALKANPKASTYAESSSSSSTAVAPDTTTAEVIEIDEDEPDVIDITDATGVSQGHTQQNHTTILSTDGSDLEINQLSDRQAGNFGCNVCGAVMASDQELLKHMSGHAKWKEFPCSYCFKVFYRSNNLKRHLQAVHKLTEGLLFCEPCNLQFTTQKELFKHNATHMGDQKSCPTCHANFESLTQYMAHVKSCGPNSNAEQSQPDSVEFISLPTGGEISCPTCHANFETFPTYMTHLRSCRSNSNAEQLNQTHHDPVQYPSNLGENSQQLFLPPAIILQLAQTSDGCTMDIGDEHNSTEQFDTNFEQFSANLEQFNTEIEQFDANTDQFNSNAAGEIEIYEQDMKFTVTYLDEPNEEHVLPDDGH